MGGPTYIDSAIRDLAGPVAWWWTGFLWFFSVLGICFYGLGIIGVIVLWMMGKSRKRLGQEYSATLKNAVSKLVEPGNQPPAAAT
jgi:hypothetical protein